MCLYTTGSHSECSSPLVWTATLPQVHPQAARRQSAPTEAGADSEETYLTGERPRRLKGH